MCKPLFYEWENTVAKLNKVPNPTERQKYTNQLRGYIFIRIKAIRKTDR